MTTAYRLRRWMLASPIRMLLLLVPMVVITVWLLGAPHDPPNDEVLLPESKFDGFTLETVDPDALVQYEFSHGPLEPLGLIGGSGFRWITFDGRTYQGHFADLGMFYRDEYSPVNSIVVRHEIKRTRRSKWPYLREVTITDSSTDQALGRAERWYGNDWKGHPSQEWERLSRFIAGFLRERPVPPFTIVPMNIAVTDIQSVGISTKLAFDSKPPEFDDCAEDVGVAEYGHSFGIKTATWAYYSLGWMEYVYCRGDQIFLVLSDGMPSTNVFDLVWLDMAGSFRGRFRRDLSRTEASRAPFWIESLEHSEGKITIDRRSGLGCSNASSDDATNENCGVRSALIEIDIASGTGPPPFVNERIAALIRRRH